MFYPGPSTLCFHRLGPSKYRNMAEEHDKIMFLMYGKIAFRNVNIRLLTTIFLHNILICLEYNLS